MRTLIGLILFLLISTGLLTQEPTLEWAATYPGAAGYCMALDSSGNVFAAGPDGLQPYGITIVKYSPNGQLLWARRYADNQAVWPTMKMAADINGNVYVMARDYSPYLVKFNSQGVFQWVSRLGGGEMLDMVLDNNSQSIFMTGVRGRCYTVRINMANGDTVWTRRYDFNSECYGIDISSQFTNNIYSCGIAFMQPGRFLIIAYDLNGNLRWLYDNVTGGGHNVSAYGNSVYGVGAVYRHQTQSVDAIILKISETGQLYWLKYYVSKIYDAAFKLIKNDYNHNVIIAGNDQTIPYTERDFCTIKYDSSGNLLWVQRYDGPAHRDDFVKGLAVDRYGNIYVAGSTRFQEYPPRYYCTTIKYNGLGIQKFIVNYPNIPYRGISPSDLILDRNMNIYLSGEQSETDSGGIGVNLFIVKYSQPIGIEPISTEIPKRFELYQNYPNPFNPITKIKFSVPKRTFVKITIYDAIGKEIAKIVSQELEAGIYETEFNANTLSSGVYFYKFVVSDSYKEAKNETHDNVIYTQTRKMVVVK